MTFFNLLGKTEIWIRLEVMGKDEGFIRGQLITKVAPGGQALLRPNVKLRHHVRQLQVNGQ